jgi:hypothetical protein
MGEEIERSGGDYDMAWAGKAFVFTAARRRREC